MDKVKRLPGIHPSWGMWATLGVTYTWGKGPPTHTQKALMEEAAVPSDLWKGKLLTRASQGLRARAVEVSPTPPVRQDRKMRVRNEPANYPLRWNKEDVSGVNSSL